MDNYGKTLVAHRGFSAVYPENTLLAVQSALSLGACFVEVDVHLSADGVPVVAHDADLSRTAGVALNVMDCPFAHLQQISVHEPQRFANRYLPQRIPSLQAVADAVLAFSGRTLFIEAKRASIKRFGIDAVLDAVAPIMKNLAEHGVLISYDHHILAAAQKRGLGPVGWVFENWDEQPFQILEDLRPEYVFTDYAEVPQQYPILPTGPWRWALYTIDDPNLALQWFQRGADLVETNDFGALIKHPGLNAVC